MSNSLFYFRIHDVYNAICLIRYAGIYTASTVISSLRYIDDLKFIYLFLLQVYWSKQEIYHITMTTFSGLLLRWKASVYKIIWVEMLAFLIAFFILSFIYRYGLPNTDSKETFEELCEYAMSYRKTLPISFILGFYVTVIYNRWWSQFNAIPRPDAIAANVAAHIKGNDEDSKLLRRTMVRYVNLAATLCYCAISTSVKKRFPTQEHLVKAGKKIYNRAKNIFSLLLFVSNNRPTRSRDPQAFCSSYSLKSFA